MDRKYICPNCDREYTDPMDIYPHNDCGHDVCTECGSAHIEDCAWMSKQTYPFDEVT